MSPPTAARTEHYALRPGDRSPLFYERYDPGRPGAPAVALCDGIGCDGYVWRYLIRALAPRARLVHGHYPGHGRSPRPRDGARLAIADLADDVAALLDDADIDRATLVGHSMGVQVALETYRRHPDRVAALVLVCGAPGSPLRTFRGTSAAARVLPVLRAAAGAAPRAIGGVWRAFTPTRAALWLAARIEINGALIDPDDFRPYLDGLARVDPNLFLALLTEANRHSALDVLPRVAVPALVVAGDRDGFTPASLSRRMAADIPRAELVVVEGGSHTAPLERPHQVERAVIDFLTRRVWRAGAARGDRPSPSHSPSPPS